jgi:DNA repair protein RecO (recombination protein O)
VPVEIATPAFVLRARPYGESDRIVTFITEQHGKVTGIAKGARNSRRRFGGTLEPFVHVRVVFHHRPGTDLVFLLRSELLDALPAFTRDLDCFTAGSYVLELTDRLVLGPESGTDVYRLVHEVLRLLATGAPVEPLLRAFEMHLLGLSGWAPALDRCLRCEAGMGEAGMAYLGPDRGGLLCRGCVPVEVPVRPVSLAAVRELARLAAAPLASARASHALAEAGAVAEQLLEPLTSGPLRSRAFLGLNPR